MRAAACPRRRRPTSRLRALVLASLVLCAGAAPGAQDDQRLPGLFDRLRAAPDTEVAQAIERQIWDIWLESGDGVVDRLMARGIAEMNEQRYEAALASFDAIVSMAPRYAEGWNKRATVYWLLDRLSESVADIHRTLALERRHFGALSGMGLIFLESGDEEGALRAFEAVLAISPHSPGARQRVEMLRERLRDRQV